MKVRKLSCYENFKCKASECIDTCCVGWVVEFDKDTVDRYKKVKGDFKKSIRKNIVKQKGCFNAKLFNERCAFLDENNLCEIYKNLGEDALSVVCKNHPRFINDFGGVKEVSFSLSCPESTALLFAENDLRISETETCELPTFNDIDATLFNYLFAVRNQCFNVVKNSRSIAEMISALRFLIQSAQKNIENNQFADFIIDDIKFDFNEIKGDFDGKRSLLFTKNQIIDYTNLEFTREKTKNAFIALSNTTIDDEFLSGILNFMQENKKIVSNLFFAYIFKYLLTAVYDKNVCEKYDFIELSILNIVALFSTGEFEDFSECVRLYSRDIIHSQSNVDKIVKNLKKHPFF